MDSAAVEAEASPPERPELATKDFVRAEIAVLESRLVKWMVGLTIANILATLTIVSSLLPR